MAPISSRTGCSICCTLCYPTGWIYVQEVLPATGSTSYKDMLAVLALHLVLVRPVFQLNDCDMIPLLPLFSRHLDIYTHIRMYRVLIGSWGASWGPTGPPLPPQYSTFKMTLNCIDVKYAHCSYCMRIGLSTWTHNPILIYIYLYTVYTLYIHVVSIHK